MIYSAIIWPFMGAVLYSVCLAWCGAIVVSASGRSGTSWWMTMTTFAAQTPKKPATNCSLMSSNPSSSFHKSVTIKSNESSPEWRTQLESLWCVFYPPKFCSLPLHSRHLSAMTCWHARAVYDVLSYELHMRCSKKLYYCSRNVSVTVCKTKHCSQATENNLSFLAHLGLTNRPQ